MTECNRENMTKWIEALESGNFPQDPNGGYLKTKGGFCCLGVLEEIAGAEWEEDVIPGVFITTEGKKAMPALARIKDFLGLDAEANGFDTVLVYDPNMGIPRGVHGINDEGRPFTEIASLLRTEFGIPKAE